MTEKPETPLQRAQRFERETAEDRARLVDRLRNRGWSREEAIYEADEVFSRRLERIEALEAKSHD